MPGLTIEESLGEDGLYHYSTRAFRGIAESREFQRIIKKSGWKDSFVAVYAGEERTEMSFRLKREKSSTQFAKKVPAKQVLSVGQKKAVSETKTAVPKEQPDFRPLDGHKITKPGEVIHLAERISVVSDSVALTLADTLYKVQLLSLRVPIRVKGYFVRLLTAVPGLTIVETLGEDGMYHYSTGAFRGIAESREFLRIIRESGWKDCFLAVYAGRKRGETKFRLKRGKPGSQVNMNVTIPGVKTLY